MNSRPVHWLVSGHVAGRVRTACGKYDFESDVQPDSLSDRWYRCICGNSRDRDENAALNIEAAGRAVWALTYHQDA